jgi:hypothetical protein
MCPPILAYGRQKPFPELGKDDGPDHLARWDAKIAAYWEPTMARFYKPVST